MRIKIFISTFILVMALMLSPFLISDVYSDLPPDPGTGGPGTGDIPVGGSPLDGGLVLLISLGVTYGFKKIYSRKNKED